MIVVGVDLSLAEWAEATPVDFAGCDPSPKRLEVVSPEFREPPSAQMRAVATTFCDEQRDRLDRLVLRSLRLAKVSYRPRLCVVVERGSERVILEQHQVVLGSRMHRCGKAASDVELAANQIRLYIENHPHQDLCHPNEIGSLEPAFNRRVTDRRNADVRVDNRDIDVLPSLRRAALQYARRANFRQT